MSEAVKLIGGGGILSPSRTWYAIIMYCAIMGAVLAAKPAAVFHPGGEPRDFGSGPGRSVFSLGTVTAVSAFVSSFTFATADLASA
jgi:hypothetical protein